MSRAVDFSHFSARLARRRKARLGPYCEGLTLVELLVVLGLVALIGALLIQASGFFLGRYSHVRGIHREANESALRQHWFASTVQGLVPGGVRDRRFAGDPSSFKGITLQPLFAESGLPVEVRWTLAEKGDGNTVTYREEGDTQWTLLLAESQLAFEYADSAGRWHDSWPTVDAPAEWVPTMVRLVATDTTKWVAKVAAFPEPRLVEGALQ